MHKVKHFVEQIQHIPALGPMGGSLSWMPFTSSKSPWKPAP